MIGKLTLCLLLVALMLLLGLHGIGSGWFGSPWGSADVAAGPRQPLQRAPANAAAMTDRQILFGDLHTHTNFSLDAYVFSSEAVKGGGVVTPADACDFARYCSALDFWSINDHAEGLTPRGWADTVAAVRQCNARAGDPANPDMVSFLGWEWSNNNRTDALDHYGHKNVIFRTWEEGAVPTRPIASRPDYVLGRIPPALRGLTSFTDGLSFAADMGVLFSESNEVPACPDDVPVQALPATCREVALTSLSLYRKLAQWGFDSLVIPHGLAWGTTNPLNGDFRLQLDEHEQRYQKLLEVYSGHGNSELFEDFQRSAADTQGNAVCPASTENFTPCCQRAGELARLKCEDPGSANCQAHVDEAVSAHLEKGPTAGRRLVAEATLDDWAGCGQLRNTFQPASQYVPRQSAQYALALGYDENGEAKRAKFGLIGSSDGHQARPGSSYKDSNRLLYTDHKDAGRGGPGADFYRDDKESGAFYYTGGLVAAHSIGRDRDAIWNALDNRNVYATSGDRTLVWFDLLNGPAGAVPMGSEVVMGETPRFRVKALGGWRQQPGCPANAAQALGADRLQFLCGGECYHPAGERKAISRIEIVRIRPQIRPDERVAPLIEDPWRRFECPADGGGCEVDFEDPEIRHAGRAVLYYARVVQEAEPLHGGDPFGCEFDDQGQCVKRRYCLREDALDNNCLAPAEPRAWTSPIFIDFARAGVSGTPIFVTPPPAEGSR